MPHENKKRRDILEAIGAIPAIADLISFKDGHYVHALDLEVTVYGRNYNGKKVGPYMRLLTYAAGEAIMNEGEWESNTFYIVVDGSVEVFVDTLEGKNVKVAELRHGTQFGEMSVLAGVPRSATVKASSGEPAKVLEIQRPALRLLRKIREFGENLDMTYRMHSRNATIEDLKDVIYLTPQFVDEFKRVSRLKVFSKNHVLCHEKTPIDRIYIIKEGWVCRNKQTPQGELEDFLGKGFCFGIDGVEKKTNWPYNITAMGRTEIIEISIPQLIHSKVLSKALVPQLGPFSPPVLSEELLAANPVREKIVSAQRDLIETGLVDAHNLLVMDMGLCVRCGNCSLACHKIHGQSRLLRRGIHIVRLEKPASIQSVLAPSVCMHCNDPECLTGCPTGAISRFERGQVDINPATCIGCGDCATQCPYNAISLIPRNSEPNKDKIGLAIRLRNYLRMTPDSLPSSIETTEDMIAVKCNLCSDRATLNPPGSKTHAYSCEENCPTGALARINPKEYFSEIGQIEGLLLVDSRHAYGRNIHVSDPPRRWIHVIGIALIILLTYAVIIGLQRYKLGDRLVGFLNLRWITGIVGLISIAGVMAHPVRRRIYKRRAGPLRYWMLVHYYFGVVAGIMFLLHGGTNSGGLLTTLLMIFFDLVLVTGLFGMCCYLFVPRMLTSIEVSPLLIEDLNARRKELQKEIADIACLPAEPLRGLIRNKVVPHFASFRYLLRQYVKRENLDQMLNAAEAEFKTDSENLLRFHLQQHGYGANNDVSEDKLNAAIEAANRDQIKLKCAIQAGATLCRVDALIYLHRLLKLWLAPHVIATSLMLALMIMHVIQITYYALR